MAMKLLSKSEIHQAKALDQKREAEEGLKLARRVDNLREVQATEEASLQKFRETTLAKIQEEITEEARKRDELKSEVSNLESRREKALVPITAEKQALNEERKQLEQDTLIFNKEKSSHAIRVIEVEIDRKGATEALQRAKEEEKRANILLIEANEYKSQTSNALSSAKDIQENARKFSKEMSDELMAKEQSLNEREDAQIKRDEEQNTRETAQNVREILLKDREGTLLRNLQRYGN